jgi:ABC-type antimicrobial peptide transport system permease subunit
MLINFIKLAIRNLHNQKTFSILNIVGLAVGMTASMLILLWIQNEWSFNRFHQKLPAIYSVWQNQTHSDGQIVTFNQMPGGLADALKQEFPEIKNATKISWLQKQVISFEKSRFKESGYYVTPSFLEIFSFPMLEGSMKSALTDPSSILITERLSKKLFDNQSPIGKIIMVDNRHSFYVTGILKDTPLSSSLQFDFLASFDAFAKQYGDWVNEWDNNSFPTYLELHPESDLLQLDKKLKIFFKTRDEKSTSELFLQSYEDMYLYSGFKNGIQKGGRITYVVLFAVIALFTLLIACINFMNLATAIADKRSKEVGVRKVAGASKKSLVYQFLCESMLYSFISILLSFILVQILLPWFNDFTQKQLTINWTDYSYLSVFIVVGAVTGLISGSYPAFYLSSYRPVSALRNTASPKGSLSLRKALVVLQFTFSILLIITTIVIYTQVQFIKDQKLGYKKENVVYITQSDEAKAKYSVIREELLRIPEIGEVSRAMSPVVDMWNATQNLKWSGKDPNETLLVSTLPADFRITETLGMIIKEGRSFSTEFAGDSLAVLLNEEAVKQMKLNNPLQESINWGIDLKIIGVVEDFKFNDLFARPKPVMIMNAPNATNFVFVRLTETENIAENLKEMEKVFGRHDPGNPFEYRFLDDEFNSKFKSEVLLGKLSTVFACLAIIISCLGLYGLTTYSVRTRVKEIGIRKVLGANISSIVLLISKDFILLTGIAFLISVPIGWYVVKEWLSNYEYRIEIAWWIFILAGSITLTIALLTIGVQSIRSALSNPVDSIRIE